MSEDMADIHRLIAQQGVEEARRQAQTKRERALVEAAYQVITEEADKLGFTYSGFALILSSPQTTSRSALAARGTQSHNAASKRRR